jgi:WD40 repeat protein
MMQKSGSLIITDLETVNEEDIIICGKDNGNVVMFSDEDGFELEVLYSHSRTVSAISVTIGAINGTVTSADDSGCIIVWKVAQRRSTLVLSSSPIRHTG